MNNCKDCKYPKDLNGPTCTCEEGIYLPGNVRLWYQACRSNRLVSICLSRKRKVLDKDFEEALIIHPSKKADDPSILNPNGACPFFKKANIIRRIYRGL